MKKNNINDTKWESLCHQCGKCCHRKFDLVIYAVADPEYICQYLNQDNRCDIYQKRLTSNNSCMALKDAVKKSGLLPGDCGYIHINHNHKPLIMPASIEDFWKLVKIAEIILNKTKGKDVDLVSLIAKNRKNEKSYKLKQKKGKTKQEFLNTCIYTISHWVMEDVHVATHLMSYLLNKKRRLKN